MTGGQTLLVLEPESIEESSHKSRQTPKMAVSANRPPLKIIRCNETELQAHLSSLEAVRKASNGKCLWKA
jgi:DNA polymerase-3 subunit epsilon